MKINVTKKEIEKIILNKEMNIAAADLLFNFCFYSAEKRIKEENYLDELEQYAELNLDNEEDRYFFNSRIVPAIRRLNKNDYLDNYYVKNIHPVPYKEKGYELTYLKIKPLQALPYDDVLIDDSFIEVSRIGYFMDNYQYLAIMKDDVTWMSLDPNEINTMRESINEAAGHVLAFGLGLGYFPIMCAAKDNVTSVTVVEKDQKIIDIFKKHILPLCPVKNKIQIIQGDAFIYTKQDLKQYDYLFIDIWHNPEDGLPMYLKFQKILKEKNIRVSYWLEKSILAMYRRCFITLLEENLLGYNDSNYQQAENDYDQIVNDLYFKTKNLVISSYDELMKILQDTSLKNLI